MCVVPTERSSSSDKTQSALPDWILRCARWNCEVLSTSAKVCTAHPGRTMSVSPRTGSAIAHAHLRVFAAALSLSAGLLSIWCAPPLEQARRRLLAKRARSPRRPSHVGQGGVFAQLYPLSARLIARPRRSIEHSRERILIHSKRTPHSFAWISHFELVRW